MLVQCEKKKFKSQVEAKRFGRRSCHIKRNVKMIRAYLCDFCKYWHLTKTSRK